MVARPLLFVVTARGKWTSAGGVVLDRRGRVALVKQRDRAGALRWTLPKGRLDAGETLEDAAVREVLEETGLRARITGYVGVYEGKRSFVHYFVMIADGAAGRPEKETVEVRFLRPTEAHRLVCGQRDRLVLQRALAPAALLGRARAAGG